jgi:hypothetical protein
MDQVARCATAGGCARLKSLGSGWLMEFTPLARHIGYNSEVHTGNFSMTSSGRCKQKTNAKSTPGSS